MFWDTYIQLGFLGSGWWVWGGEGGASGSDYFRILLLAYDTSR